MAITKEQAIDILDKFDFFQGQRAGRELWNSKPFNVQEQDIANFSRDVALLKDYIKQLTEENERLKTDAVPRSEVEELKKRLELTAIAYAGMKQLYEQAKQDVVREIFEEIYEDCFDQFGYINYEALADLKKKYIGE